MVQESFNAWLQGIVQRNTEALDAALPVVDGHSRLHEAMRYAALGPGKRVRAALVYAAGLAGRSGGRSLDALNYALDGAAVAVELVHAYSLVHDDLPCMDDDAMRRGRPTLHKYFADEALAMLAGDALQAAAFEALSQMPIAPALTVQAVQILARAAGSQGMVGGQAIDCASVGKTLDMAELRTMHSLKTGALLQASVLLGGVVAGASSTVRAGLEGYAGAIGLAFQVVDDILDVTGDLTTLGKTPGKDAASCKPTYVSLLGLEGARALLHDLHAQAELALLPLGAKAQRLRELGQFISARTH